MKTLWLDRAQVPAHLIGGYTGRQFRLEICEQVTVPDDAGLWSGGTRDTYRLVRLADGASVPAADHNAAPWDNRHARVIKLAPGFAVIEHSIFCGRDMGLRFYVHPDNAAALLPAPAADLSELERIILDATARYKASYQGRDRYDMARRDAGYKASTSYGEAVNFPSRADWEAAKAGLIEKRLLNKAGAITTSGRNVLSAHRD